MPAQFIQTYLDFGRCETFEALLGWQPFKAFIIGVAGVAETMAYDTLGRMASVTNALGTFNYGFDGVTGRVTQMTGPNNLTSTFSYFGNNDDRRLQTILNKKNSTTLSQFDYTYDDEGQILTWKRNGLATADGITYDAAGQLKTYSKVNSSGGPTAFTFNYDTAGNREQEIIAATTTNFTFNNVNQMLTRQVGSGSTTNYTYDNNGNLTNDGARSYEWDDANRLKAIVEGTKRFEFTYDGLGRRYKMLYKTNGVTTFNRRFIWCGAQPCWESANVTGQPGVVKRYFAQGVLEGSDKYFYMRDHLGSVREVMKNNSSTVEARYDYDPWGRQTQTTGTRVFDIGYAGYMVFAPSGTNIKLNLTWYRAYSPELGRWLSRDPIGEHDGLNLYYYVGNSPINMFDPNGLTGQLCFEKQCKTCFGRLPEDEKSYPNKPSAYQQFPSTPGECHDADAFCSPWGLIKIPDNCKCTVKCDKNGTISSVDCSCRIGPLESLAGASGRDIEPRWGLSNGQEFPKGCSETPGKKQSKSPPLLDGRTLVTFTSFSG